MGREELMQNTQACVEDAVQLKELRCRLELIAEEYQDCKDEPVEPPYYKNVASLGLITLPIAWVIFDIFAFCSGYQTVSLICSFVTAGLIAFGILLKVREKKLNLRTQERYQAYKEKHEIKQRVQRLIERIDSVLDFLYSKDLLPLSARSSKIDRDIKNRVDFNVKDMESVSEFCRNSERQIQSLAEKYKYISK